MRNQSPYNRLISALNSVIRITRYSTEKQGEFYRVIGTSNFTFCIRNDKGRYYLDLLSDLNKVIELAKIADNEAKARWGSEPWYVPDIVERLNNWTNIDKRLIKRLEKNRRIEFVEKAGCWMPLSSAYRGLSPYRTYLHNALGRLGVKKESKRRIGARKNQQRNSLYGKNPGKELNKPYIEPPEEPERPGHPRRKFDLKQKRKQGGYRRAYSKREEL